jgi:hypothetical protein
MHAVFIRTKFSYGIMKLRAIKRANPLQPSPVFWESHWVLLGVNSSEKRTYIGSDHIIGLSRGLAMLWRIVNQIHGLKCRIIICIPIACIWHTFGGYWFRYKLLQINSLKILQLLNGLGCRLFNDICWNCKWFLSSLPFYC